MNDVPCRNLSTPPKLHRIPRRIVIILALILVLSPLLNMHAQAATWPYGAVQQELDQTYNNVQAAIAPLPDQYVPSHYIVPLYWADGNSGQSLIGTNGDHVAYNVQRCTLWLQTMRSFGFNSTMITIPSPMLAPSANYPGFTYYAQFYTQVVAAAKSLGFWIELTSGFSPVGTIDYSRYPSIDQVFQNRREQAWWMARNLQPDWITVGGEAMAAKGILRAVPDARRLTPAYWGNDAALVMAGKPTGTPTKYAAGASPSDPQAYYDAVVATSIDGIDAHPFPLLNPGPKQLWQVMLDRMDQAKARGKPLLITQTSPWKESKAELARTHLSFDTVYLRDVWDGFQPQDQHFMRMWQQITIKKGLLATSYWWSNRTFLGGYIPYQPQLTYAQASSQVDHASLVNLQSSHPTLNTEGRLWASIATSH